MPDLDEQRGAPPDIDTESPRSYFTWLTCTLMTVLLLYILSIGPAIKVCDNHPSAIPAFKAFYAPIVRLAEQSNLITDFLHYYAHIWGVRD